MILNNIKTHKLICTSFSLTFYCLCSGVNANADPISASITVDSQPRVLLNAEPQNQSVTQWVNGSQQSVSDSVHSIGEYLDTSLTKNEDKQKLINRTYLRLRNRALYSHRGYFDNDFKIYFKLDLPHLKRDWKLILDSEPSDYDSLENKQRGIAPETSHHRGDTVGGFRLQDTQWGRWRADFDLGIKLKLPLDPFTKARVSRVDNFSTDWTSKIDQELFYYHSKGLGSLSELSFYYALTADEQNIFRTSTSAQYLQKKDKWELVQQVNLYQRLNKNNLLEHSMGISADTNANKKITNYWLSTEWKRCLYKDWLFLSARPQLDFPNDYDHHANLSIMFELEIFFSKNRDIDVLGRYIPKATTQYAQ